MFSTRDLITAPVKKKRGRRKQAGRFETRKELILFICTLIKTREYNQREIGIEAGCCQATVSIIKRNNYQEWLDEASS